MPRFCYKYLKQHIIYNTVIAFPFFTIFDFTSNKLLKYFGYLYQLFVELLQYSACISSCLGVIIFYNDLELLCQCLSQSFYTAHIMLKRTHFKIFKNQYKIHLNGLEGVLKNNKDFDIPGNYYNFDKYFEKKSRFIHFLLNFHFISQFFITTGFFGQSTYYWLTQPSATLQLPIVAYIPFEVSSQMVYNVVFISQYLSFLYFNPSVVASDYFVMDVIVLHSAQIEFLDQVLSGIIKCSNNGVLSNEERENCLKMWIKQHQATYKYSVALRELIGSFIMIEYSFVLTFGFTGTFVVFSTTVWKLDEKMSVFGLFGCSVMVLLLFAHIGNRLDIAVRNLGRTFYGSWLISWRNLKTEFLMYTQLHHKPFLISYHLLSPLGFPTCSVILRLIVSYFMALQKFQSVDDN